MKKFILILYLLSASCSTNVPESEQETINIPPFGNDNTFEIATWNIENFPKNNKTPDLVKEIIEGIDIDLIAVQEIASISDFNYLINVLPGWKGELSSDTYANGSYQKTGILYKSRFISVSSIENIFNDDNDAFPRPPLRAFVEVKDFDGIKYNFNIIVLHLKASGFGNEQENIRRRRDACQKLELYIAQEISNGADVDFIVLGDWNDQLTDTTDNVFHPFLDSNTLYTFLTLNLGDVSYPSYDSLIDHILISADSKEEFNSGEVVVLKLDNDLPVYKEDVSDHRPVAARFNGFNIDITD